MLRLSKPPVTRPAGRCQGGGPSFVNVGMMPTFVLIRERAGGWDWGKPMREQAAWDAHAAFMDRLANDGVILAGGPLGGEDEAPRVLHVVEAPDADGVERIMAEDPWTPLGLLRTLSIEPWTVLLGGFRSE